MIKSDSWTVLDNKHAVKKTDLSVFKNFGSGIPVLIRPFFDIEDLKEQESRPIVIAFDGVAYPARVVRKKPRGRQTQILWNKSLSNALNEKYPDVITTEEYPELHIYKVNKESYVFTFEKDFVVEGDDNFELKSKEIVGSEGNIIHIYSSKYERNPALRKAAIDIHGLKCYVCGFEFEKKYGDIDKGYIEVHHKKPLSEVRGDIIVNPKTDMVCLCSNCHRMVHRKKDKVIPVEKLKEVVEELSN